VYIGANQDAFAVGHGLNIGSSANFVASAAGTRNMYLGLSDNATMYRSRGIAQVSNFFDQKEDPSKKKNKPVKG
jgi:hypothetical protein